MLAVAAVLWHFANPVITHSAVTAELDAAVGIALAQWGAYSAIEDGGAGTDIVLVWGDSPLVSQAYPDVCYDWDSGCATPNVIRGCIIEVDPLWPEHAERDWAQDMITHEVGHCLGLEHPGVSPSIMEHIADGFSDFDAETIAARYPAREPAVEPYRLLLPGIEKAPQ